MDGNGWQWMAMKHYQQLAYEQRCLKQEGYSQQASADAIGWLWADYGN